MEKENVKLNFIHVCENAFFSDDKKLNIINIFDTITVPNLPAIYQRFFIVLGINGDITKHRLFLEIKSKSNKKIVESEFKGRVDEGKDKVNLIVNLRGVKFEEDGVYKIIIKDEKGEIENYCETFFNVVKVSK